MFLLERLLELIEWQKKCMWIDTNVCCQQPRILFCTAAPDCQVSEYGFIVNQVRLCHITYRYIQNECRVILSIFLFFKIQVIQIDCWHWTHKFIWTKASKFTNESFILCSTSQAVPSKVVLSCVQVHFGSELFACQTSKLRSVKRSVCQYGQSIAALSASLW